MVKRLEILKLHSQNVIETLQPLIKLYGEHSNYITRPIVGYSIMSRDSWQPIHFRWSVNHNRKANLIEEYRVYNLRYCKH